MIKYPFYSCLAFISLFQLFNCMTVSAQLTTVGEEFWLGFMENFTDGQNGTAVIVISANEKAQGTIDLSNFRPGLTYSFNLQPGQNYTLRVPEYQDDLLHRNSGMVENKGIHIVSDGKISVYAFNERIRSADGTVVLPVTTLGKDYYVASHFEITPFNNPGVNLNENNESTLLVIGVEDNTTVEITPSTGTVDGKSSGIPFQITLNTGQSYQLKARGDLTGSRIRVIGSTGDDCKNVAVFGGNKWTGVGKCGLANDHLYQQMYPITTWGKEFIHIPLKDRSSGELVKIIAAEDDTQVSIDGATITLDQGEFRSFDFGPAEIKTIVGSKPISVTTYSKSLDCNNPFGSFSDLGDPFMITYSPNEQLLKRITFEAMNVVQIQYNYANIIVASKSKDLTFLDGQNIGNQFQPVPSDPSYSYARVNISSGSHQLSNEEGFIAYVYGFGNIESYGYSVGANLENLNFIVESQYDFEVEGENVACLGQESNWSIEPENDIFTYFVWDFGDSTPNEEGKEVHHMYTSPGIYTVKIVASISENSCEQQEDIVFEVEVKETKGELYGASMACPNVEQLTYKLMDTENISKVEWEVDGGQLISSNDSIAVVNWGAANPNAFIKAIPFTDEGCPGAPIQKDVGINQQIEPLVPTGQMDICFDPEQTYTYEVTEIFPQRGYQWYVDGGQIVSEDNQSEVQIRWNTPNIIGKVWYEEHSLVDQLCTGVSQPAEVRVLSEFKADYRITDIACFNEATGAIELVVLGGQPPYTFEWQHDASLSASDALSLKAGEYSVIIRDGQQCEIHLENLEVKEPEELSVNVGSVVGASCYGKADGEAFISVEGGIEPYSINYQSAVFQSGQFHLTDLLGQDHLFVITDANFCQTVVSLNVPSPEPLVVDVQVVSRSCPGEANGELLAVPTGGSGPFTYTWDIELTASANLSGIPKGVYGVSVIDQNGCVSLGSGEMTEKEPEVRLPTGFYPDSEGANAIFQPISNCNLDYKISIYNRWGELIFSDSVGWDGKIDGEIAQSGSYSYILQYTYSLEGENFSILKRGIFTLLN